MVSVVSILELLGIDLGEGVTAALHDAVLAAREALLLHPLQDGGQALLPIQLVIQKTKVIWCLTWPFKLITRENLGR